MAQFTGRARVRIVDERKDTWTSGMAHGLYFVGAGLSKSLENAHVPSR